ncbi:predicted protein [Phaeodactylum tricornutum CCAP 1055/1]|jgi:hypothetical protein|uniref:Sugar phosphate transporter domain-containing protein n=1 Tax=Phaeodactylum tricornutum (strain CCAP 1055/1) TaxID=556484 RepID=B7GE90_PHATC|nr:predicted protein [Phaeodactylum tricornutum CCAP 1055/1]EEC43064.1 predicted protein [Phaeodactylum tricornutum CCAP 1055/1]|eukprot:XP_002185395.1 predicted protein [Phaeodactylum tricornutum CCAP 1055/1]
MDSDNVLTADAIGDGEEDFLLRNRLLSSSNTSMASPPLHSGGGTDHESCGATCSTPIMPTPTSVSPSTPSIAATRRSQGFGRILSFPGPILYNIQSRCTRLTAGILQNPISGKGGPSGWFLLLTISAWFGLGVVAIVTTKLLLTSWKVPPLLLTFQQLTAASTLLRVVLGLQQNLQPLPWENYCRATIAPDAPSGTGASTLDATGTEEHSIVELGADQNHSAVEDRIQTHISKFHSPNNSPWNVENTEFFLIGLFNALDFLASNTAFSSSAASFVETIKASDPITTTAVALIWKIDQVKRPEAISLMVLIIGVLLSTIGNATSSNTTGEDPLSSSELSVDETDDDSAAEAQEALYLSIRTAITVVTANLCFAFRAMNQKLYRRHTSTGDQLDDANLLCRLQQTGALSLLFPTMLLYAGFVFDALWQTPREIVLQYVGLAAVNAGAFVAYNLAACYVLSNLTVLHYSGLGCMRRMFAILSTSIFFGVPISILGAAGIVLCLAGFLSFTYTRSQRTANKAILKSFDHKDSNV